MNLLTPEKLLAVILFARVAGSVPSVAIAQIDSDGSEEWLHLSLNDLDIDVRRFEPVRARYLQTMYDLEGMGRPGSTTIVHIEVDRAIHSGIWDGSYPASIQPFREPGLMIDWQVQNSIYNAFDRILTDSRLSVKLRYMPASAFGLRVGSVMDDVHSLVVADPDSGDVHVPVSRIKLPDGSVNILTVPYILAAMDLDTGDRFTLPGFQPLGGVNDGGLRWRGAYEVESVSTRVIRGESHELTTVIGQKINTTGIPDSLDLRIDPGERVTRFVISEEPPYLIGRGNYLLTDGGRMVRVREQLDVVEWAPIPLPSADLVDDEFWDIDPDSALFRVAPEYLPEVLVPRD